MEVGISAEKKQNKLQLFLPATPEMVHSLRCNESKSFYNNIRKTAATFVALRVLLLAMKITCPLKVFVSSMKEMWAEKRYRWLKEQNAEQNDV